MMGKKKFLKSLSLVLDSNGININSGNPVAMYNLMCEDFTDDEFKQICEIVAKEEELYGKYPIPNMFYKRKGNIIPKVDFSKLTFKDTFEA